MREKRRREGARFYVKTAGPRSPGCSEGPFSLRGRLKLSGRSGDGGDPDKKAVLSRQTGPHVTPNASKRYSLGNRGCRAEKQIERVCRHRNVFSKY